MVQLVYFCYDFKVKTKTNHKEKQKNANSPKRVTKQIATKYKIKQSS